jgi:ergothioneine biosynthesis protein EgtB
LVYDLQHLLADQYRPVRKNEKPTSVKIERKAIDIKGGLYDMGYNGENFCYDIELPEHKVYLNDYKIDIFPVTNKQYLEFINDGGYETYKHWLSDGWEKVKKNNWNSPMYWEKIDEDWMTRDFLGLRKLNPNEPVCHVSYYEADAYCKWAEKRLPTEAEWEKAACWNENLQQKTIFPWGNEKPTEQRCNLFESHQWGCTEIGSYPEGASYYGCHQMIGDVWEWTSSEYVGYPGFKSGFDEYNDKWFSNQKVLRGGSFGTPKMSIRGSYRNFFRLDERWLISGFRCVENL